MELWVIVALVVLAVAVVGAGAYWYYRQHTPARLDAGATITPQSIIVGELSGVARSFPLYAFPDRAFPIWGTDEPAPPAVTSFSHVYLYAQRRRRR